MLKVGIIADFKQEAIDKINRVAFDYVYAVEETGIATAYIIPCNTKNISRYVDDLDAFIIPGGDDIDPSLYKQENRGSHDCEKKNIISINSIHYQVIDKLGNGLKILGVGHDGYIEAIQHKSKNMIGIQWHPESIDKGKIFFNILFSKYSNDGKI